MKDKGSMKVYRRKCGKDVRHIWGWGEWGWRNETKIVEGIEISSHLSCYVLTEHLAGKSC